MLLKERIRSYRSIISKPILLVSLVSFFNDIGSELLYPVMPVFLSSVGFSVVLIGVLEGMAEATAGISKGYFGRLSDQTGKRVPFIRLGYLLSAVAKPLLVAFTWVWWIFAVRTADRLGKGIRSSARDALLSDETLPENKGKVFGFHRAFDTLGAAIGPFIALLYLWNNPEDYKTLFLLAIFPGVVSVLITLFLKDKNKPVLPEKSRTSFFGFLKYYPKASADYKLLIAGLLFFTLFNSSDAFLLLGLKESGLSDAQMIGFYIFYNLIFALAAFPVGIIADKAGLHKTLIAGVIIFAMVYAGMGMASATLHFAVLFALYGLYAAATDGVSKALITNHCRKEETATGLGLYNALASIATLISSSLAGLIWYSFGAKTMFLIAGTGALISAIYLTMILNRGSVKKYG